MTRFRIVEVNNEPYTRYAVERWCPPERFLFWTLDGWWARMSYDAGTLVMQPAVFNSREQAERYKAYVAGEGGDGTE